MNEYQLNPDVCPSSLNETGLPATEGETGHVWDETTDPITCSECGAEREAVTKEKALETLDYVLDYYLTRTDDRETQLEVIEMERWLLANLN